MEAPGVMADRACLQPLVPVRLPATGTLQEFASPHRALADIKLSFLLGSGGFSPVFAGGLPNHPPPKS